MSRLADFIDAHTDDILDQWVRFASTLAPMSANTPLEALRDHAAEMLAHIALDLRGAQTPAQQRDKSEGRSDAPPGTSAAGRHGCHRQTTGLDVAQMVSEFRALRATVIRLWAEAGENTGPEVFDDVLRFNEAIDQAVAESITAFAAQVEHFRQLMLGMVAHDLRGPLSVIGLCASVLVLSHERLAQDPSMGRLQRAAARAEGLVDDVLEVAGAKLRSPLPAQPAPMDLSALAREAIDEARAEHPHAEFLLDCPASLCGEWDRGRLAQLLLNLLRNAVEHGDGAFPVRCAIAAAGDGVTITVQNHGTTIPLQDHATIFDALVRVGASEDPRKHLGLGLYICRDIAQTHGGTIALRSDAEAGTVFSVWLPRCAGGAAAAVSAPGR